MYIEFDPCEMQKKRTEKCSFRPLDDPVVITFFIADIDECVIPELNKCDVNANCTNIDTSYECECRNGWKGDGGIRENLKCTGMV